MNAHRTLVRILITSVLTLSSTWVNAEPPHPEDAPPKAGPGFVQETPGFGLPPHLAALGLSEAQEDKIFYILHAEAPAIRNNFKQQRKLREEIDKLVTSPGFDEKKARQLSTELARAQGDAIFSRINTESRIRAVLTPEQLIKLDEKRELDKPRPEARPEHHPLPASKAWEGRPREPILKQM